MCYDPDQHTEPQAGLEPKSVEQEIAEWIDPQVIASCILTEMADQDVPLTADLAKKVWYDILENFHSHLETAVDRIWERANC